MEIAVVGGNGTFGGFITDELRRRGHNVRVLSRNAPQYKVDLTTGAGLREALEGVEVVVNSANDAKGNPDVLAEGTRRLLAAEAEAHVSHHVLISIVGIDRAPFKYLQAKLDQEQVVRQSPHPSSILRATQFHQLLDQGFSSMAKYGMSPRSRIKLQPVDPREVAAAMADGIAEGAWGYVREVAGPDVHTLSELARTWSRSTGTRRLPIALPLMGQNVAAARNGALTVPEVRGKLSFADWLAEQQHHVRPTPALAAAA